MTTMPLADLGPAPGAGRSNGQAQRPGLVARRVVGLLALSALLISPPGTDAPTADDPFALRLVLGRPARPTRALTHLASVLLRDLTITLGHGD